MCYVWRCWDGISSSISRKIKGFGSTEKHSILFILFILMLVMGRPRNRQRITTAHGPQTECKDSARWAQLKLGSGTPSSWAALVNVRNYLVSSICVLHQCGSQAQSFYLWVLFGLWEHGCGCRCGCPVIKLKFGLHLSIKVSVWILKLGWTSEIEPSEAQRRSLNRLWAGLTFLNL